MACVAMELTLRSVSGRLGQPLPIVCLSLDPSPFFLRATGGDGFAGDTNPTPRYSATNVLVSSVVRTITIGLPFMEPRYCHRVFPQPAAILDISASFLCVYAGGGGGMEIYLSR